MTDWNPSSRGGGPVCKEASLSLEKPISRDEVSAAKLN